MIKRLSLISAKLISFAFFLHLLVFYLRLGWFLIIIWAVGIVVAVWITQSERKNQDQKTILLLLTIVIYFLSLAATYKFLLDQKSYRTFSMTWTDKGVNNQFKESEIDLEFVDFPGHHQGVYSNEVSNYLYHTSTKTVPVIFEVTSDFGCLRGFNEIQIGELTHWKSIWGYSSYNEVKGLSRVSPWSNAKWWCP